MSVINWIYEKLIVRCKNCGTIEEVREYCPKCNILIHWEYEDQLPEMTDEQFNAIYKFSKIISGVRMYPYFNWEGERHYLGSN